MKAGCGTNSREELLALWSLLFSAQKPGINQIAIAGDSKMIIGWEKGDTIFQVILLEHWKARIKKLITYFSKISFQHVYREFNFVVDSLSNIGIGAMDYCIKLEF